MGLVDQCRHFRDCTVERAASVGGMSTVVRVCGGEGGSRRILYPGCFHFLLLHTH